MRRLDEISLGEVEELLGGRFLRNFPELNITLVIVGHPDFLPVIFVEVGEGEGADGALGIVEDSVSVLKLARIASRVKGVSSVVAIASDEDMGALVPVCAVRPDSVSEAW